MKFSVMRQRSLWWSLSSLLILAGLIAMLLSWFNPAIRAPLRPGLDFSGGTRLEFELACATQTPTCAKPIDITTVREVMSEEGLGNSSIQILDQYGVSIRTQALDVDRRARLQNRLSQVLGKFNPQSTQIDIVGPTLGQQILVSGLLALLISFVGITLYLTVRFQLDYAFFAIVALFHDVLITVGFFSILGLVAGVEVDSLFIVALLTIVGFSVNDTVVIYDRVRENLKLYPERSISETVDAAVNQTLTRSLNTTLTVLLTLLSIYLFGGETLKYFALALIIGFTMGAYSSIFIASTLLAWWRERNAEPLQLLSETAGVENAADTPSEQPPETQTRP
uniref:Protein-export membrane protein SecF n=1 Tax=Cyanothece sp. (strain PCC 7425 / ATCC 29141) TaxID=395961 RepID=B8HQ25_CYAP4